MSSHASLSTLSISFSFCVSLIPFRLCFLRTRPFLLWLRATPITTSSPALEPGWIAGKIPDGILGNDFSFPLSSFSGSGGGTECGILGGAGNELTAVGERIVSGCGWAWPIMKVDEMSEKERDGRSRFERVAAMERECDDAPAAGLVGEKW